ncbi:MotA/TolQ/ExbB proton channel family protein [Coraliomargarita sp. SDUM461004]|uniref:MotA/TolQ/ExbB proton channel family protein n=1 Tax=Thalassobacterium sedimentorum TaxID=3041258 RepID=A0ABU1AKB9_9BACT|nr:MotA/TolQ/ExbB proton channel family protein [Coraliomargarita sp. SDUM461004]MDQ8195194.1 MotA/TolQ/ExbB proton channel family protein [Coraliomargarita sp. SDUM461004]
MDYFQNNFILQGGPVMYPLLFVSLLGFVIFIERALYLHKGQIGTEDFLSGIKNLVRKKRLVEALTLCEDTPGPMARIVKSALLHYGESRESIRAAIQSAAIVEIPTLERRIGTLAALARVAPLLGFLGTLIAALQALYSLESFNGDSGVLSRLLAEALVTSASGLAISVMAMLAYHFLSGRVRALVHDFEWMGHDIHEFLSTEPRLEQGTSKNQSE